MKEDFIGTIKGILITFAVAFLIWGVAELFSIGNDNSPKREPTAEDYEKWHKEYVDTNGTDPTIEVHQQYGSR